MRIKNHLVLIVTCLGISIDLLQGQTFTMGKSCSQLNAQGLAFLQAKKYDSAQIVYNQMKSSCKTKDAKIAIANGIAESYNGMGKYDEAIAASNEALKITKNSSINGWFQKAVAENKTGQIDASKASLGKVIELTEKNQNTKQRASNYALMAALYDRQLDQTDSAHYYIDKAIAYDSANYHYHLEKGDMYARKKQYDIAFEEYNMCEGMGKNDLEIYQTLCDTRLRMLQEKYNTTNTQQLRSKLTADEKNILCNDLKKAQQMGMKNMSKDMLAALICK